MPGLLMDQRKHVVITGTPGTGKSSICERLMEQLDKHQFQYVNLGEFAKQQGLLEDFDEVRDSHVLDEDELVDALEPLTQRNDRRLIFDYHGCDFLPEDWIGAIFVLRTDNGVLYERLEQRGYSHSKIQENVQCEIFQEILEEAYEAFEHGIVHELQNNTERDMQNNVQTILRYLQLHQRP